MLSSVTPGNGTPSVLRTVLRPPSAPTSQATRTVSPLVSVAVTLLEALLADMLAAGDEATLDPEHSPDFTDRASIRWHVATFWTVYRTHLPVFVALREAAMVDPVFHARLREIMLAEDPHFVGHLGGVRNLPGAPHLVISAFRALLDQFAWLWLAGGGDGSGPAPSDDEAIELLTTILHSGIAGRG